jgi:hypothetical protein
MANYRRTATGNWTNLAQWEDDSGGSYAASSVLPGPGDVVYANGFTVTLDVDVVVDELRTTTAINVLAGGTFTFGVGNILTANIFGGGASQGAVTSNQTTSKTINGNISAIVGGSIGVNHSSTGTLVINGNTSGGIGGTAPGVRNSSTGTIIINGNSTGGNEINSYGANNASSGMIIINGISTGGTAVVEGAFNAGTGVLRVTTSQSSNSAAGVNGANVGGTTIVENIVWSTNGRTPTVGFVKFDNTASKSIQVTLENNSTLTLVDPSTGFPTETDVRDGVSYASGALTGTLVVPSDDTVTLGVVYDNGTIGTAQNTAASFLSEISTSPNLLAERLRNVSTVESTAATVASFKV